MDQNVPDDKHDVRPRRLFVPGGPPRFRHQVAGLRKMIETRGVCGLLYDPGCIFGDAEMTVNRAGKSFKIALRDLVNMFNGGSRGSRQTWDPKIPTRVQRRSEDGTVRLVPIRNAWFSGEKQTYTVTTESGRWIRATDEHPFLTEHGWSRLDHLTVGVGVYVNGGRSSRGKTIKQQYRGRAGLRHHPNATRRGAKNSPYRVPEHSMVVEADLNDLPLDRWLEACRKGSFPSEPRFLPRGVAVHHIDGDHLNNDRSNLAVMTHSEHHRLHAAQGKAAHVLEQTILERVVSIEPYGVEETYDIEVEDDPHNFIANGFVVHNTGKTATTLDYASLLALKSPRREARVLVLGPLAAVDTWVTQSREYVAEGVAVWAEALGGSIRQKAEALASRGGNAPKASITRGEAPRALGHRRALALDIRPADGVTARPQDGPDGLGTTLPRLVLISVNLDSFNSRASVGSGGRTMADLMVDAVRRFGPDLIVVDESHRIKSATSNTSRAVARLTPLSPRRVILTGTVMPHSPLDVFGQWRFLDPYAFGTRMADGTTRPATFGNFRSRYARMGGWMGKEVLGFKNLDEMRAIMARNSIVARKTDALDLPPVTETVVRVDLSPAEKRAYEQMRKDLAVRFSSGQSSSVPNRLAQLMRLRQITSGYLPDDSGDLRVVGESKARVVRSLVHDTLAGESRLVVFAHFTPEIDLLSRILQEKGTEVEVITGATKAGDRARIRKRFGSSDPTRIVLIAQTRTLSLAVNELVTASHAIFASLSQQRDDDEQAIARLDRQGQRRPVTIWRAIAPGTVDEVILGSHRDRTNLESAMLRHINDQTV